MQTRQWLLFQNSAKERITRNAAPESNLHSPVAPGLRAISSCGQPARYVPRSLCRSSGHRVATSCSNVWFQSPAASQVRVKGGEFSRTAAPGGDSRPISLGGGLEMCATFDVFGWRISFCISLLVGGWTLLARGSGFGVGTAHGPWSLSGPAIKHLQRNLPGSAGARGRLKARPSWAGCQSSHSVGDDWEL